MYTLFVYTKRKKEKYNTFIANISMYILSLTLHCRIVSV